MKSTLRIGSILACLVLAFAARCWNVRDVLVAGRIYFVDADCYSRMTRAREVVEGQAFVVRHHDFENWPHGVTPHTTAPMDWAIVALARVLDGVFWVIDHSGGSVLHRQTLDLAGALISPLCGVLTCAFAIGWGRNLKFSGWLAAPLLLAVSPIMVHGTVLGRPDHQSLQILLLAIALGSELALAKAWSKGWGIIAGVAWALGLWVSLYEPLVLLVLVLGFWLCCDRRRFAAAEMRGGWIAFAAVIALGLAIEGWRVSLPDAELRSAFGRWETTIGELAHLDPRSPLLYRWVGAVVVVAPLALIAAIFLNARAHQSCRAPLLALLLLLATLGLTIWQLRWGYFLAVALALSLPWAFALPRRAWIAWPVFLLCLWPLAQDWDEKLFPDDHPEQEIEKQRSVQRLDAVRLREIAERMRSVDRRPFLAPWWLSPALAYWSGQPGVAGSSHQSLPGIVATARFFLAPNAAEAERIVHELGVKWVVTDDPDRLRDTSRALLGEPGTTAPSFVAHLYDVGQPRERVTAADLRSASPAARDKLIELADRAEAAQLGSAAFSCVMSVQFYKLFSVKDTQP